MNKQELLQKYIQLKQQEKQIKEEIKHLQEILLQEIEKEEQIGNYKIVKVVRYVPKLKKDIDILEIQEKYPDIVELKINPKKAMEL
jgi:Ser-tRNA(Ala) deacylase AlaX